MKFIELNLDNNLVKAVEELGFESPTFIQEKSIPVIKEGKDVIAQSETGSGKTAAFGLPILEKITQGNGLQCVIIAPTRELAEQLTKEINKFSKYKRVITLPVYGGVSINPQIQKLPRTDIVVATPGRLTDHIQRRTINFKNVKFLVLDEADKMFEMGFIDDIKTIIHNLPTNRQTLLFSATISKEILHLAQDYMKNPVSIKTKVYVDDASLKQEYYNVQMRDKFSFLLHILKQENPNLAIVFCGTRHTADLVSKNLYKNGVNCMALHGGFSQNKRNMVISGFHSGKIHILIATDVAARGLDIKNVTHIINYDIPKTSHEYVHRIGRTARAGKTGKAISILSERDHDNFRRVLEDRSLNIDALKTPEFQRVPFFARSNNDHGNFRSHDNARGNGHFRPRDDHSHFRPGFARRSFR